MDVAPTKDCIYVLLDFEGVNSPERHRKLYLPLGSYRTWAEADRPAQEDMLLVLFNAALSNMVLVSPGSTMARWSCADCSSAIT